MPSNTTTVRIPHLIASALIVNTCATVANRGSFVDLSEQQELKLRLLALLSLGAEETTFTYHALQANLGLEMGDLVQLLNYALSKVSPSVSWRPLLGLTDDRCM